MVSDIHFFMQLAVKDEMFPQSQLIKKNLYLPHTNKYSSRTLKVKKWHENKDNNHENIRFTYWSPSVFRWTVIFIHPAPIVWLRSSCLCQYVGRQFLLVTSEFRKDLCRVRYSFKSYTTFSTIAVAKFMVSFADDLELRVWCHRNSVNQSLLDTDTLQK